MVPLLSDLLVRGLDHVGSAIVGDPDGVGADRGLTGDGVPVLLVGGLDTTVPVARAAAAGSHLELLTGGTARAAVADALGRCDDRALAPAS